MDRQRIRWYYACMMHLPTIPEYMLYGETDAFPDVVHCEHIKDRAPDHGWRIAPHRHAQLAQVFFIQTGHATSVVDGQEFELSDNQLFYIPAQAVHSFAFAPNTQGMVQSFPISVLRSIAPANDEVARALSLPFVATPDVKLLTLMTLLDATLADGGPYRTQTALGLAHAVLSLTAARNPNPQGPTGTKRDRRLAQLDQLISDPQTAGWRVQEYAAKMGLSTGHLSRLCRAANGLSASAYIDAHIIQEACRLLAFTQLSVAEVGYRLGFTDPSYFSRRFRAVQQETPSVYRQRFVSQP
ncbi:helix-turn-helix domain-containing protein [Sulfitobacter sp.]|jgi:AraC family transcriptional activator of pobA|uniref:helix-turn-helix domain-containing protein n=1 Tax=Sulfitobacter sp. TaxID=1903071 RepID=UPI0039E3AF4C